VWRDETPVAVIEAGPSAGQERVYYLHADHLGTPRRATDQAKRVVWRWESDAFGTTAPEEYPDRDGQKVAVNLRFPGQYFDSETGLHYNYFRDYDPGTGRYVQGDPIGLAGDINAYTYVNNRPFDFADPEGLTWLVWLLRGIALAEGRALAWCLQNPLKCQRFKEWATRICAHRDAGFGRAPPGTHSGPRAGKDFTPAAKSSNKGKDCTYCGAQTGNDTRSDHVYPRSRSGDGDPTNLVPACPGCNDIYKNDNTPLEWELFLDALCKAMFPKPGKLAICEGAL
jgi:RHS repeat-associated protein